VQQSVRETATGGGVAMETIEAALTDRNSRRETTLTVPKPQAATGLERKETLSALETIEGRIATDHGAHELRKGLGSQQGIDLGGAESSVEQSRIGIVRLQLRHGVRPGIVHLDGIAHRLQYLVLQGQHTTIPEKARIPCQVDQRHRIARALYAIDPRAELVTIVSEGDLRRVAGGAGHGIVS
jgi:hypothetical protein